MTASIHVHQKVEKALEQMATQDNAPKIAAQRAQAVIKALVQGIRITRAGRLSLRKDTRISNLYKFNLGKGYRLISIKEKESIYIMFVGTHDHCDRWLDSNSKKKPHREPIPTSSYGVAARHCDLKEESDSFSDQDPQEFDPDLDIPPEYSQETLRKVFCGIVSNG